LGLGISEEEGRGKKIGDGGLGDGSCFGGEEDDGVGSAELVDGLAAGSAGLAGGGVEVGDRDGSDADAWAVQADCGGDGGLLGADGETIGGVFDVAAGDDIAVGEQKRSSYAEVAVRSVGVVGDFGGALLEVGDLGLGKRRRCEVVGWVGCGHVVRLPVSRGECKSAGTNGRGLMIKATCPIRGMWTI
jgi:hypothetical protein